MVHASHCGGRRISALACLLVLVGRLPVWSEDRPQWGEQHSRNMVSSETGLPETFDPATNRNVRWSVAMGTSYATPVIAHGRVLIGCNNQPPRDPRHEGDRGVLVCLDEADGRLLWQLVVPKLQGDIYLDWPQAGICSAATVEGDRVYAVTNRAEVVCLDLHGLANGNDGPYTDEGQHLVLPGEQPMEVGPLDADILWLFDMPSQAGMYPHDSAHSSILLQGDHLYLNTGNGLENTHQIIRKPDAPSLIVLDKHTGRLVAQDAERIGPRIFHSTWSSPALGVVNDQPLVFFAGGDGVVYAFHTLRGPQAEAPPQQLQRVWRFDCDPTAPKENVHRYIRNRRESPSNIKSMPVYHDGRVYVTVGGDIWWGKHEAWLKCIDATQSGEITQSGLVWSYTLNRHCCATPAIYNGMAFVGDCGGVLHCVDLRDGQPLWTHDCRGEIWSSPLVADGRVYQGTRNGHWYVLAAQPQKQLLAEVDLDDSISGTPVAANGTLYVPAESRLYALRADRPAAPAASP